MQDQQIQLGARQTVVCSTKARPACLSRSRRWATRWAASVSRPSCKFLRANTTPNQCDENNRKQKITYRWPPLSGGSSGARLVPRIYSFKINELPRKAAASTWFLVQGVPGLGQTGGARIIGVDGTEVEAVGWKLAMSKHASRKTSGQSGAVSTVPFGSGGGSRVAAHRQTSAAAVMSR